MKFFFQDMSWNTVSGSFHETWNTFMEYFYFSIQHSEAVVQMCSGKKVFLEISQKPQEITCTRVSFLIKLQAWGQILFFNKVAGLRPVALFKKSQAQVFSCEFCGISKNIFFYRTPLVAASEHSLRMFLINKKIAYRKKISCKI